MTKPKMAKAPRFWKLAAAWALVIFVLSSIPGTAFPASKLFSYDKLLHAGVYAVLGAFCFMAVPRWWSQKTSVLVVIAGAMATLYGFTDEFHQLFVPGRSSDLRDVLADCVGGFAGAAMMSFMPFVRATGSAAGAVEPAVKSERLS
jgi:VanZ family protein